MTKRYRKYYIIATIIFIPTVISLILWLSGLLSIQYLILINLFSISGEFIIFVIFVKKVLKNYENNSAVAIPKVFIDEKFFPAGKEIFEKYIVPVNPHNDCIFRIKIEMKEHIPKTRITIIRKCSKDTCESVLNDKVPLDVGMIHIFHVAIDRKERLNFKFDKDVTIKSFSIDELYSVR